MSPADPAVENSAGPATRGPARPPIRCGQLNLCETLYAQPGVSGIAPYLLLRTLRRDATPGTRRPTGKSSTSGMAFYLGPPNQSIHGALFFADYHATASGSLLKGTNGVPGMSSGRSPMSRRGPVDLRVGPGRRSVVRRPERRKSAISLRLGAAAPASALRLDLPERPDLDIGDERLGPGREGQVERRVGGGRRAHITLNGHTYAKGFGVHALSDVRYALAAGAPASAPTSGSTARSAAGTSSSRSTPTGRSVRFGAHRPESATKTPTWTSRRPSFGSS